MWTEVRAGFAEANAVEHLDSILIAAGRIVGAALGDSSVSVQGDVWAQKTVSGLMWPEVHRWNAAAGLPRYYLRRLMSDRRLRQKYLRDIADPTTVRDFVNRHLILFRGYQ